MGNGRREFLQHTIAAAAGAPLVLSQASSVFGAGRDVGQITLDALLVTYFAAPIGSPGNSRWEMTQRYETALSLGGLDGVDLRAAVPSSAQRVFVGSRYDQASGRGGQLVLRRHEPNGRFEIGTVPPGTADHTVFYGLLRPVLQLRELDGGREGLRIGYRLVGGEATFIWTRNSLLHDEQVIGQLDPRTVASYLAAYQFDREALVEPRYEFRDRQDGAFSLTLLERGRQSRPEVVASTSSTIVAQEGIASAGLAETFAVGTTFAVEHSSRQTPTERPILKVEADLDGQPTGVYWDRVFKTFVFDGQG